MVSLISQIVATHGLVRADSRLSNKQWSMCKHKSFGFAGCIHPRANWGVPVATV